MSDEPKGFRIEIDPGAVDDALRDLRTRVRETFTASRHTKVRLSYRGKQLGPDLPLAIFLAGEGAAFWLLTPLAALLVNLGAKAILDVEFVHAADELVAQGQTHYLSGELAKAEACYRKALEVRPDDPGGLYNLGVVLRVQGHTDEALVMLRHAAMGPEKHPDVLRASELLSRLGG